jgi:predicted transposase YdaD
MADTDHPLKRLIALAAADFAVWLLDQPVQQVTTRQGELTAVPDPIDTDQVLFVTLDDGREVILHVEFQGPGSDKPMPLRMLDYSTRLSLAYRDIPIHSVVLYLGGAGARDTGQHTLYGPNGQVRLSWYYAVVPLWQLEAETLLALNRPALLALIGQTRIQQPAQTIPQAVASLVQGTSGEQRERLLAEFLLLCTDKEIATMAEQIITRDYGLPETPMMRKLREQGREEGREEGQVELLLRQLIRRCGPLSAETTTQVQQLHAEQLLELADALLDFTSAADLEQWLATYGKPDPA